MRSPRYKLMKIFTALASLLLSCTLSMAEIHLDVEVRPVIEVQTHNGIAQGVVHTEVRLEWVGSDAFHYDVLRTDISGGYYAIIGSSPNGTFIDHSVQAGKTYYYVIRETSNGSDYEYDRSNEVMAVTAGSIQ
jgi:hypothetical protein